MLRFRLIFDERTIRTETSQCQLLLLLLLLLLLSRHFVTHFICAWLVYYMSRVFVAYRNSGWQRQQEISACDESVHYGFHPNTGRGAPEIDILETMAGTKPGVRAALQQSVTMVSPCWDWF